MKLSTMASAAKAASAVPTNHAILIYGPPKSGKTRLVGTAAKIPEVQNIYFFSLENGHEVLIHECDLTEAEMEKITWFRAGGLAVPGGTPGTSVPPTEDAGPFRDGGGRGIVHGGARFVPPRSPGTARRRAAPASDR